MPRTATRPRKAAAEAQASAVSLPPEVLALLTDLSGQVKALRTEVSEIKESRPESPFRPMNHLHQPGAVEKLQIPKDGRPFFDPKGFKQKLLGNSFQLTPEIMQFPKRFRVGSRVRINRDAERGQVRTEVVMRTIERRDRDGKPFTDVKEEKELIPITWGELIDTLPRLRCPSRPIDDWHCQGVMAPGDCCPDCGWASTVARVEFINERGQWVYRVNFPGISSGAREQSFEDWELEPA